jgi:hypothetical protein
VAECFFDLRAQARSIDDILLSFKYKYWRDVKLVNEAGSIVLIFLEFRDNVHEFKGSQRQTSAKFC